MSEIIQTPNTRQDDSVQHDDPFAVTNWVWVKDWKDDEEYEWFACVMKHGSNYVEVQSPSFKQGHRSDRIHVDNLYERLRPEPNPEAFIAKSIETHQGNVKALLGEISEVTARLGVVPRTAIAESGGESSNALAVISEQIDADAHKKELIKAKDEDLPALFKKVEEENHHLAKWMGAQMLPMQATVAPMKDSIKGIETRIYTIEIYAGLSEGRAKVRDGEPAEVGEKLHVMQRLHYMDEECLLDYDAGGMEIDNLEDFDAWLSRDHNLDRLLPFPRCCVAFRVRRGVKERFAKTFSDAWFNIQKAQTDMWTFLYVRNGDQLWRIGCDFEFPEKIFPDADDYDPTSSMMIEMWGNSPKSLFTRNEYEVALAEHEEKLAKFDATPQNDDRRYFRPSLDSKYRGAQPFDPSSVYYDDAMEMADEKIREFNRVGVILQGLFDRSEILHPHYPVKVWDPESFTRAIELVYDSTTLTYGEAPDFEEFRAKLNKTLGVGSVVIGQEDVWELREGERETKRRYNDWRRDRSMSADVERYRPYGNPGPGFIAEIAEWKPRAKKATFRWEREPMRYDPYDPHKMIADTITVEGKDLFNVSAYQPGDYLRFFRDPRTRQQYLQWAPILIAAEEYHAKQAGNNL